MTSTTKELHEHAILICGGADASVALRMKAELERIALKAKVRRVGMVIIDSHRNCTGTDSYTETGGTIPSYIRVTDWINACNPEPIVTKGKPHHKFTCKSPWYRKKKGK